MAFTKKTWKNRLSEYPARRVLTKENSTTEIVTVARSEGIVSEEGDAFSAANMNDLETRISNEFNSVNSKLTEINNTKLKYKDYNVAIPANTKLGTVEPGVEHTKMYGVSIIYNDIAYATLPTAAITGASQIAVLVTNVQTSGVSVWVRLLYRD